MQRKTVLSSLFIFTIITACLLEMWLFSYGKKQFGIFWSPLIVFVSGLLSGVGFLAFFYKKEFHYPENEWNWKKGLATFLVVFFGVWKCGDTLRTLIRNHPIDFYNPTGSDVIPQIGILVDRFLSGIFPYQIITEWTLGHALFPTYLPLTWMPFIITEWLGLDYRWLAFAVLILAFLFFYKKIITWNRNWLGVIVLLLTPFLFLYLFQIDDNTGAFRFSVEVLITGYYLFLATSLFSKSNWLRALALIFCLLSRYSVVLWVPLFFFVLFFKEKKKNVFQIGGWIMIGILGIYVIPFLSQDWTIFLQGYEFHTQAAPITFERYHWQLEGEMPALLTNGFGLAIYFNQIIEGTVADKVWALRTTHFVLLCITVLSSMLVFYKIKDSIDYRIFLLGTLKIYLVVFYNFIHIPFNYLFLPLVFVSLPMMGLLISQIRGKESYMNKNGV